MQPAKIVSFPQKEQISKHNLPAQPTPLIGRERDVASVAHLLRNTDVRLLTLTGTAGVGKTRLALQVAVDTINVFTDGVYFVPLASISDPGLVVPAIAQTLGLGETANLHLLDLLNAYLQHKHLLLLLDNFEQILPAAAGLADLLATCPHLKLLVTSREVLHLRAEHQYPVPPLALPNLKRISDIESLAQYAAVELFIERTQAVKQNFALTEDNAPAVAQICSRLDGLPLAIELAAARVKLLSPQVLLARLEHRLEVLTGGAQDLPERQQTLRNTIEWSYDLLSAEEQRLFRRLSVFAGGCILEAVEAICTALGDGDGSVLNNVASLIDKSLLQHRDQAQGELRLEMLETIHEYGLETLGATGEREVIQRVHAEYYLKLAEEAEPKLTSSEQLVWLEQLEREHDNLRAALRWSFEQARNAGTGGAEQRTRDSKEMAWRLGGALQPFWFMRCYFSEGQIFLEQALAVDEGVTAAARAKVLFHASWMAFLQGDYSRAEVLNEESLKLYRELVVLSPQETIVKKYLAIALNGLGWLALIRGDYAAVDTLCEESLPLFRQLGDLWRSAEALFLLAHACDGRGDYVRARATCEKSLALCREIGERLGTSLTLLSSGYFAYRQDEYAVAQRLFEESLAVSQEFNAQWLIALCLVSLGEVVAVQGQAAWAARVWGAAEALRETYGLTRLDMFTLPYQLLLERAAHGCYERAEAHARIQLGEKAFSAAWSEGRTMTPVQALALRGPAREPTPTQTDLQLASLPKRAAVKKTFGGLTEREREVAALIAQGKANREIAEVLVVNYRTVEKHIENILSKLGFASRTQIAVWATEKGSGKKEQS